jgi:hypothetical protein
MTHNPNEAHDIVRAMKPGDTVSGLMFVRHFPVDSILESVSSDVACVAYRVADRMWTVTGHGCVITSTRLPHFANTWRVIRVGDADAERERREAELREAYENGEETERVYREGSDG